MLRNFLNVSYNIVFKNTAKMLDPFHRVRFSPGPRTSVANLAMKSKDSSMIHVAPSQQSISSV